MNNGIIRPLVICPFQKDNRILVAEGFDESKGDHYYRPIGGGIEFGESSADALKREVEEEIQATISNISYLGTIENIFQFNGKQGHEIVQVCHAEFADSTIYELESFEGIEDNGTTLKLYWKSLSEFEDGNLRLVPENLLELLKRNGGIRVFRGEPK
ncbi:NUDIX hydrolase [Peribacillus frigoritolerans]|uniref:NUDIX hydrolase n=1 Tax=Peribacillus frigoritolerans TaxID=450367 RepID=UPI00105A6253|nr:NUDIX domain-containing protein [Peribacillus frigoritolerans]TDL82721.1 NUDIX domain-containing protein [Peribacillus frigoritolerans]